MTKVTPFRMIGNVYFVGTVEASSHLIDTGDGLILIDTGYEENAETVVESMNTLGFDIKDVKIILHSHGHYDHTGATAKILTLVPSAKTYLSFHDIRYIKGFQPDFDIQDGDVIALGNTKIECWFTPGHTEGSVSFFLDVVEDGQTYRAGMFGGSGVNQLKKDFMNSRQVPYLCRGLFFDSVERLLTRKVDVMIGNHSWQNHTLEKYEKMKDAKLNPFIDPLEWDAYLTRLHNSLQKVIETECRTKFISYARCAENILTALDENIEKGANGIQAEIYKAQDGAPVLSSGIKLEEFLKNVSDKPLSLSLALQADGLEKAVVDLLYSYGVEKKTIITSLALARLQKVKEYAPYMHVGYSAECVDESVINSLLAVGVDEICPNASIVTAEQVQKWHKMGFNVCVLGVTGEQEMKRLYDLCVDGLSVEEPSVLQEYIIAVNG